MPTRRPSMDDFLNGFVEVRRAMSGDAVTDIVMLRTTYDKMRNYLGAPRPPAVAADVFFGVQVYVEESKESLITRYTGLMGRGRNPVIVVETNPNGGQPWE